MTKIESAPKLSPVIDDRPPAPARSGQDQDQRAMPNLTESQAIDLATEAALTAREFCSSQRAAILEALREAGYAPTRRRVRLALAAAHIVWSDYQQEAGVTHPISAQERHAIERRMRDYIEG